MSLGLLLLSLFKKTTKREDPSSISLVCHRNRPGSINGVDQVYSSASLKETDHLGLICSNVGVDGHHIELRNEIVNPMCALFERL